MGNQTLPRKAAQLKLLGSQMQAGMNALSVSLALTYISNADMLSRRKLFSDDDDRFNAGRSDVTRLSGVFQNAMQAIGIWN